MSSTLCYVVQTNNKVILNDIINFLKLQEVSIKEAIEKLGLDKSAVKIAKYERQFFLNSENVDQEIVQEVKSLSMRSISSTYRVGESEWMFILVV